MMVTTSERLVSIVTVFILVLVVLTEARKIDCTKFVFAPKCRGVAAKRDSQLNFPQLSRQRPFNSLPSLEEEWNDDDDDTLEFLKGLKFLISRINEKNREKEDERFWGKLFDSSEKRR